MDSSVTRRYMVPAGILAAMALVLVLLVGGASSTAQAQETDVSSGTTVFGLTTSNELVGFNSATPGQVDSRVAVSGLSEGETLINIDYRPATGVLFGISDASIVYTVDPTSGVATAVSGEPLSPILLEGNSFGFDFNPTVDLIRVVSDEGQNLRLNPDTGNINIDDETGEPQIDGELAYAEGDPNAGVAPNVVTTAYSENFDGAEETVQYDIDSSLGNLVIQDPPNDGVLSTVGPLGVPTTSIVGLDITTPEPGTNLALAALQPGEEQASRLYTVDLSTGAATDLGQIGEGEVVRDVSIPIGAPAEALPETGGVSLGAVALTSGALLLAASLAVGLFLRRRTA